MPGDNTILRRIHFENMVSAALKKFGGDFDGTGLARGIERGLASIMLIDDEVHQAVVEDRLKDFRGTKSTDQGIKIGQFLGQAYELGASLAKVAEAEHV